MKYPRLIAAVSLLVGIVASCTNDFDAPFAADARPKPSAPSPDDDGASPTGTRPADVDGGCNFFDDYGVVLGGPESWFRLDEDSGNFKALGTNPRATGYRKDGNRRVAIGAIRAKNGAQHLDGTEAGFIGFGDVWPEFNGGATAGDRAIEMWFRQAPGNTSTQTLFSKIHVQGASFAGFHLVISGARQILFERFGAAGNLVFHVPTPAPAGVWHHVVLQRDATARSLSVFVDGVATVAFDLDARSFASSTDAFMVGPLEGEVDEIAVHARPLSSAEVRARLDAAAATKCKGKGETDPRQPTTCYGPSGRAHCANDQPVASDSCKPSESCVMIGGEPTCVAARCPE